MTGKGPPRLPLADQVAAATGLAGMLATGAVERCCERAGVDVRRLRRRDLKRMLPQLETVLLVYLTVAEADAAVRRLTLLSEGSAPAVSAFGSRP
jgi:hypothetical protein